MRTTQFALMAQVLLTACGRQGINTSTGDPATDAVINDLMPVRTNTKPELRPRPVPTYSVYAPLPRVVNSNSKPSKRATNAAKRKSKKTSQKRNRK